VVLVGLGGLALSLAIMHGSSLQPVDRALIVMAATALPMLLLDLLVLRVHRNPSTGLVWPSPRDESPSSDQAIARVVVKLIGLTATLAVIGTAYWLFPVYRDSLYDPYWTALREIGPWCAVAAVPYFFYIDRRMADPYDGYWQAGMAVLGHVDRIDGARLRQHALGWLIKAYFLPLMFAYLTNTIGDLLSTRVLSGEWNFLAFYDFGWNLAFTVDLAFISFSYALTLRLFDSHIRSAEPTFFGWAVAVVCYQPFWILSDKYLSYDDDLYWGPWLRDVPTLQVLWGSTILALLFVYAWASVTFGCRFSNLTHRGILTNGPYRWTKHPAYLSKNLVFWLVSIPFVPTGSLSETVRHCLMLLGVNAIYFLRARTEERHLSRDPTYVAYALWIEQHGLLRAVGWALPFLRYAAPVPQQKAPAE
jgi:protein-S-isoprenylcysteine O-methyltransferase Ste14